MESIEDVCWNGIVRSPALIEKLPRLRPGGVSVFMEGTRRHLLRSIDQLYPPWSANGRNGAVLKAVLLGDRSSLDSETIENFRKTGLYHLLVIAGLHVGLLAMLLSALVSSLRLREPARTAILIILLSCYACLVEQRAPTLRATLMIVVVLVARLLDRDHGALNSIGLAGLILLVYRPA